MTNLSNDDEWFKAAAADIDAKGSYVVKPLEDVIEDRAMQTELIRIKQVQADINAYEAKEAAAAKAMFDAVKLGAAPVVGTGPDTKWPSTRGYAPSSRPGSVNVVNIPGHGSVPVTAIQKLLDEPQMLPTPKLSDKKVIELIVEKIRNSPDPFAAGGEWMMNVTKAVSDLNRELDQDTEDL